MNALNKIDWKYISLSIVLFTLFIFIAPKSCTETPRPQSSLQDSSIVYLADTSQHSASVTNIYQYTVQNITLPQQIDTAAILRDYFSKVFATDTLQDSLFVLTVNDTLSKNRIAYRHYSYRLLKPFQVIKSYTTTLTNTVQSTGFYAGAYIAFNLTHPTGAGVKLHYTLPRYSFGLGLDPFQRQAQAEFLIRIKPHDKRNERR